MPSQFGENSLVLGSADDDKMLADFGYAAEMEHPLGGFDVALVVLGERPPPLPTPPPCKRPFEDDASAGSSAARGPPPAYYPPKPRHYRAPLEPAHWNPAARDDNAPPPDDQPPQAPAVDTPARDNAGHANGPTTGRRRTPQATQMDHRYQPQTSTRRTSTCPQLWSTPPPRRSSRLALSPSGAHA